MQCKNKIVALIESSTMILQFLERNRPDTTTNPTSNTWPIFSGPNDKTQSLRIEIAALVKSINDLPDNKEKFKIQRNFLEAVLQLSLEHQSVMLAVLDTMTWPFKFKEMGELADATELSRGSFSVAKGITLDGQVYILKEIPVSDPKEAGKGWYKLYLANKEMRLIQSCDHPNIIKGIDIKYFNGKEETSDVFGHRHHKRAGLILENCSKGSLFHHIGDIKNNANRVKSIFLQIVNAVLYLHEEKNIIHGDICPENIFLSSDNSVKLGDFGNATLEGDLQIHLLNPEEVGGAYTPQETPFAPRGYRYGKSMDIWHLGVLFLRLFGVNDLPKKPGVQREVIKSEIIDRFKHPQVSTFLDQLLDSSPANRPTIRQITENPIWTLSPKFLSPT